MPANPYAPPDAPIEPGREADLADLFVAMQPTSQVRAAGVGAILTGVACLFVALQFVLGAPARAPLVMFIECMLAGLGGAFFVVARALLAARAWAPIAGIALCLATGTAVLAVFLVSGAMSAITAGGAAAVTLVLHAVALGDHRKMSEARAAMLRAERRA